MEGDDDDNDDDNDDDKDDEMMMMVLKVTDRFRLFRKGIMAASLEDLIIKGKLNNSNIFSTCKNSNFPRAQSGISLSTRFCA